jgi:hypothetical protein
VAHLQPIGWSATSVPEPTAAHFAEALAELAEVLVWRRAEQASPAGPDRSRNAYQVSILTAERGARWSQPQRPRRGFHGLVDDGEQLSRERVQLDLPTQPGAERLHGLGRVVVAAVEAPVDQRLDAAAGRLDHRRHGKGRGSHHQAGALAEELAEPKDDASVAAAQQQREQPIGHRPADNAVQVIQPDLPSRRPAGATSAPAGATG